MSKVVVIGANHAGTAAINTLLTACSGNQVTVYDRNDNISFLGCGMALWIGKQISSSDGLFYSSKEKLEAAGAAVHMEADVRRVDFVNKRVHVRLKDGSELEDGYDKLVLATGSLPVVPKIPGVDLKNVQLVKLFQNARDVIDKLGEDWLKRVVIVGAGYIGVELAEAFRRQGKTVTLIDEAEDCLSSYYDKPFTDAMAERLASHGIELRFGERVAAIKGAGKAEAVVTGKGEYPADMVVLCVGFKPNSALGEGNLKLFSNGAYLVDKRQRTNLPDVYAIGDCATVFDNALGRPAYIALATNAVRSGLVAAYNICGLDVESLGVQGSNGICVFEYKMVSTGLTLARAMAAGFQAVCADYEDNQKPEFIETGNSKVKIRIVYDRKTRVVLGAQMASEHDISMGIHMFSLAVQEKVTIDKLKLLDIFFLPHFNKPYNYLTMAALQAE